MDHNERYYRRSLRDVLVGQGILTDEAADELVQSAFESNEPFGSVLVESGIMTAWDLAKTVSAQYQMPVLPLSNYQFDATFFNGPPPSMLYQYQIVPVGRFGSTWSFASVEPPSRECVEALREHCGSSLFFFVSEVPHIQQALQSHVKVVDMESDSSWQSIFESGEKAVLEEMENSTKATTDPMLES